MQQANIGPDGKLIHVSNCRACVHWEPSGIVNAPGRPFSTGAQCTKRYRGFPKVKDCQDYERVPGADDE